MTAPALPPGFVLDGTAPALPEGFNIDTQAGSPSLAVRAGQQAVNVAAGAVRGAGSIGATLLAPFDIASDALAGMGLSLESNRQRRADIDAGLVNLTGADPASAAYQGGKLATEVAGTLGVGGALANAAARIPGAAGVAAPVIEAVRTAGMSAGGATGAAGLAARSAGGALTGATAAGLVDPTGIGSGAAIGAALPGAMAAAGKAGQAVGNVMRGPLQSPELAAAIKAAREAGYVIPPTQAKASLANRVLEGTAGKITTAQNASARNQAVTNRLASKALGLPAGAQITPEVLQSVRQAAGQAYEAVGSAGTVIPGQTYTAALDRIAAPALKAAQGFPGAKPSPVIDLIDSLRSPAFDASSAVAKISELRSAADDAFRAGSKDLGRAAKAASTALEDALEAHLAASGQQQLLHGFRESRKLIAKTYTVEKALNAASGTVDARVLAKELQKGKPLTGELRTAASFADTFPKAAQTPEVMGSLPQMSPLDWFAGAGLSAITQNPLAFGAVVARPAARAAALSPLVQARLLQTPGALNRLPLDVAAGLGYRAAPVTGSSGP